MADRDKTTPKRIQRQRSRGWRMPDGAIYVGRGSRWGNPFPLSGFSRDEALRRFRLYATGTATLDPAWLLPLRGHDLACWCKPTEACHADILLEMANV